MTEHPHLTDLPGTSWRVWRDALLRSAGFPADGLDRFSAPAAAAAADAQLAGAPDGAAFAAAYAEAVAATGRATYSVAADPRFREAVGWQNPGAVDAAAGVLRDGPDAPRNSRRRRREELIAKYWQRYCAKNDTVGFYGPICWVTLDAEAPPLVGGAGPGGLTRGRTVFFEWWALDALAALLAEDPAVRRALPAALQPQLSLDGTTLRSPHRPPATLPPAEAALLARCDGRRTAAAVAADLVAAGAFRREDDVLALLGQLAERELVRWDFGLPLTLAAERTLHDRLAAIADDTVRERATGPVRRLAAARDALAAAEGPDAVTAALSTLEETFVAVTGRAARQKEGQTYAGRTLVHLESVRNAELTLGGPVLAALAPLEPLLRSSRWLTGALADAYETALAELYTDLAAEAGDGPVGFGELWFLAQGAVFGQHKPADAVVADFCRRWIDVFGLEAVPASTRRLDLRLADVAAAAAAAFPAERPGWAMSRIHSPDVHLLADGPEALARGEFTAVLGELHIGWAALDTDFFRLGHPDPERLRAGLAADLGTGRVHPLLPSDWPRHCARNADWMDGPDDVHLGFVPAPITDPDRLLPVSGLTVGPDGTGRLVARAADGRSWPLVEVFAGMLGLHAFDTWKLAGGREHTPRTSVDGLVLVRETWRTTVGATGLAEVSGEAERYLAVRRWKASLGLPERVFVRVATEVKPCYVDLSSPVYARVLCTLLRGARQRVGDGVEVAVSEMLPTPQDAWMPDAEGRRYCSELRLQVLDPVGAA